MMSAFTWKSECLKIWRSSIAKEEAVGSLYETIVGTGSPFDPYRVWNDLCAREKQGRFYMGEGLLLPHVRVKEIQTPVLAFGVCAPGVALSSGERAQFILLLLSPEANPRIHLQVIQAFANLLENSERKAAMLGAETSAELFYVLN